MSMENTPEELVARGYAARRAGLTKEALDEYRAAADLFRNGGNALRLAHTVRHVGDILRVAGRLAEARPCYEEAVAIYRQQSDSPKLDVANALRGFALLSEGLGEVERAKALWREARDCYAAVQVKAGVEESAEHLRSLGA